MVIQYEQVGLFSYFFAISTVTFWDLSGEFGLCFTPDGFNYGGGQVNANISSFIGREHHWLDAPLQQPVMQALVQPAE
jgi:hypothetical protein